MTRHQHPEPLTVVGAGGLPGSAARPIDVRRRHRPTVTPSLPHPAQTRVLMKGNEAMAEAAIQAGCDAYFGYPITPQAELLEWMARRMPEEGRAFVQAESEIAAINMALGAAATGARVLVSSSSPGISLMAEAMSYMAAQELPMVLINVMRGGPGLGSIQPSQADYFQAVKGHGHGDYKVPVLAPGSIPEAIELVATSFELAERYRTPVMMLTDGIMGQAMEPVEQTDGPRVSSDRSTSTRMTWSAISSTSSPSTATSPRARSAGPATAWTTRRSWSSRMARPRASPAPRWIAPGRAAARSACSGPSRCSRSRPVS